jgi:hypothetical protein
MGSETIQDVLVLQNLCRLFATQALKHISAVYQVPLEEDYKSIISVSDTKKASRMSGTFYYLL